MSIGGTMLRAVIVGLGVGAALTAGTIAGHVVEHDVLDSPDQEWAWNNAEFLLGAALYTAPLLSSAIAGLAAWPARLHSMASLAGAVSAALASMTIYVVNGVYLEVRDVFDGWLEMDATESLTIFISATVVGALTGVVAPAMRPR